MSSGERFTLAGLALGVVILIAYSNSFGADLVLDARPLIESDPRITSTNLEALKFIFTRDYWWPQRASDLYRPLTTLSYWFNYTILRNGIEPTGYHVVNFLLHWANAWMVLAVVRRLSARLDVAVIAGMLFAVHPVATEAVTNVAGRADLLATFLVLTGGLSYIRGAEADGRPRFLWLSASCLAATLAPFAKETGILLIPFILLHDVFWRRRELNWRAWLVVVPGVLGLIVARAVVTRHSLLVSQVFVDNPIAGASWFDGFLTACAVIGRYLVLLVFPRALSSDYSYNQIAVNGVASVQPWLAIVALVALAVLTVRIRRSQPLIAWGAVFTLVMLIPTSNLVVTIGSIMGERFLYLPSIGFCAGVAGAAGMLKGWHQRVVVGAIVLAFVLRTNARNEVWQNEASLWTAAVRTAPNSFRAHAGYANSLILRDQSEARVDQAIASAERALAILETPPLPIEHRENGVLLNLGVDYRLKAQRARARGDTVAATTFLRKSVNALAKAREIDEWFNTASRNKRIKSGFEAADIPDVGNPAIYVELADSYLELREWLAAQGAARYAQRLMPDIPRAYIADGVAAYYLGQPGDAAVSFAIALILDADAGAWDPLIASYRAMNAEPPVAQTGAYRRFDVASPRGQELVIAAGRRLIAAFETALRFEDAQALREELPAAYGLDPRAFAVRSR